MTVVKFCSRYVANNVLIIILMDIVTYFMRFKYNLIQTLTVTCSFIKNGFSFNISI